MERLLSDDLLRSRLGDNARVWGLTNLSLDRMTQDTLVVYEHAFRVQKHSIPSELFLHVMEISPHLRLHVESNGESDVSEQQFEPVIQTHVVRIRPDFMRVIKERTNKRSGTYVLFSLAPIPKDAEIRSATIRFPAKYPSGKLHIYKIKHRWLRKPSKKTPPTHSRPVARILTPTGGKYGEVYKWRCTFVVKRWKKHPKTNKGVYLSKRCSRKPSLIVRYRTYR